MPESNDADRPVPVWAERAALSTANAADRAKLAGLGALLFLLRLAAPNGGAR